jgi:SPP1 family phage portal protein
MQQIVQEINGTPTPEQITSAIEEYIATYGTQIKKLNELYNAKCNGVNTYHMGGEIPKLNFPIARYITTLSSSYIIGKEPLYSVDKSVLNADTDIKNGVDYILKLYRKQSINRHKLSIRKQASKTGFSYEYVYLDKNTLLPKIKKLPEDNTLVVFDTTIEADSAYGVYWSEFNKKYTVSAITADEVFVYTTEDLRAHNKYVLTNRYRHYTGRVPITLISNNEEQQGDYEGVAGLIEAFNDITTDERFDIKRTVNAILIFINTKLSGATPEEKAKIRDAIKALGILELPEGKNDRPSDVKALQNPLDFTSVDTFVDRLWKAIFQLSMIPDPSRQEFYTAISGVALDMQMFMGLDQLAKSVESEFDYALRRRMKMYARLLSLRNIIKDFDTSDVDIQFRHTRPQNNSEIAQMIAMLSGGKSVVSSITLAKQLDFVDDAEEEVKKAQAESGQASADEIIKQLSGTLPQVTG